MVKIRNVQMFDSTVNITNSKCGKSNKCTLKNMSEVEKS